MKLQYGNFGIDQLDVSPDEVPAFLLEQFSHHGEPLFARDCRALGVETHVQVSTRTSEPIEGRARHCEAALEVLVEAAVELSPQVDLPVEQPPLLPGVVEEPLQVHGKTAPLSTPRALRVDSGEAAERVNHGSEILGVRPELGAKLPAGMGENIRGGKLLETTKRRRSSGWR